MNEMYSIYQAFSLIFIPFTVGYISFIVYIGARNSSFSVTMRSLSKGFRKASTTDERRGNIRGQLVAFYKRFKMNNGTLKKLIGSIKYFILFILVSLATYLFIEFKLKDIAFYTPSLLLLIAGLRKVCLIPKEVIKEIDAAEETIDLEIRDILNGSFVNIESGRRRCYVLDIDISRRVSEIATIRGISPEELINRWVQERLSQQP